MAQKRSLSPEQDTAANPTENIWVQANAGTGKTSVLVQRLLRILFRTNQPNTASLEFNYLPGILCLTYTNAGASEMRNRILLSLRQWAMATDEDLRDLLFSVSYNNPATDTDIQQARNIFFQYIDNPDMLKIKTIHGFCEEILRRFPLEAGISPAWKLVSDSGQKIILKDAFHRLINTTNPTNFGDDNANLLLTNAFTRIVERVSEHFLDDLLSILTSQYKSFFQVDDLVGYREYFIDTTKNFLNLESSDFPAADIKNLETILESTQNDINSSEKPAGYLINIVNLTRQYIDKAIDFEKYKSAYLTADNTKIVRVSRKDYLVDEQERVHQINQCNLNQMAFDDTIALFDLSAAFAKTYKEIKTERNLLDFDDLILHTRKLFSKPDTMGWVLSQLDSSLTHILVDEAQDTSPEQWEILRMLAGDFFTAGNTAEQVRSLFVVGDSKQSIFGFQGADPLAFDGTRREISAQIKNNLRTINEIPLTQSFRSTQPILSAVDFFFNNPQIKDVANFINNDHKCFRKDARGLVEIHPLVSKN